MIGKYGLTISASAHEGVVFLVLQFPGALETGRQLTVSEFSVPINWQHIHFECLLNSTVGPLRSPRALDSLLSMLAAGFLHKLEDWFGSVCTCEFFFSTVNVFHHYYDMSVWIPVELGAGSKRRYIDNCFKDFVGSVVGYSDLWKPVHCSLSVFNGLWPLRGEGFDQLR